MIRFLTIGDLDPAPRLALTLKHFSEYLRSELNKTQLEIYKKGYESYFCSVIHKIAPSQKKHVKYFFFVILAFDFFVLFFYVYIHLKNVKNVQIFVIFGNESVKFGGP